MREQLNSELKLLNGKLNSLDEFRLQKDELMEKFDKQQLHIERLENEIQITIYESEKSLIIEKDKLKKEMCKKLQQLASDFQQSVFDRMAITTKRLVCENIGLNAELSLIQHSELQLRDKLSSLIDKFKNLNVSNQLIKAENNRFANELASVVDKCRLIEHDFAKEVQKFQYVSDLKTKLKRLSKLNKG